MSVNLVPTSVKNAPSFSVVLYGTIVALGFLTEISFGEAGFAHSKHKYLVSEPAFVCCTNILPRYKSILMKLKIAKLNKLVFSQKSVL